MRISPTDFAHYAAGVESLVTSVGIAVAGVWTWRKFFRTRERYPHADVAHEIAHRRLDDNTWLLSVDVICGNRGQVMMRIDRATTYVSRVSPTPSAPDTASSSRLDGIVPIQRWPLLAFACEGCKLVFSKDADATGPNSPAPPRLAPNPETAPNVEIEPGEAHRLHYDFSLPGPTRTVVVYSYVENFVKRVGDGLMDQGTGWSRITFHDLEHVRTTRIEESER